MNHIITLAAIVLDSELSNMTDEQIRAERLLLRVLRKHLTRIDSWKYRPRGRNVACRIDGPMRGRDSLGKPIEVKTVDSTGQPVDA